MTELVPSLMAQGMSISVADFNNAAPADTPFNLINISDFNSLIAQSQKHSVPVFALTDEQIEQSGIILERMKRSREDFRDAFGALAQTIEIIAGLSPGKSEKVGGV